MNTRLILAGLVAVLATSTAHAVNDKIELMPGPPVATGTPLLPPSSGRNGSPTDSKCFVISSPLIQACKYSR